MKRALLVLAFAALSLAPAAAHADWFGMYAQGQSGLQKSNRTSHPFVGASAGVYLLGFEGFADLRFLGDGFAKTDRGWWNQLGVRWGLVLPVPKIRPELFAGLSYVASKVPLEDWGKDVNNEEPKYKGLNPHVGARVDIPIAGPLSIGAQGELGYHYLFPNGLTYSSGCDYALMADLKLGI